MKHDEQLQQDVFNELKWEPSVNADNIGVMVKDGIVTLSGHVHTFAEKWRAEEAALRVAGVKALVVEVEVKLLADNQRPDADIARSAENVVRWSNDLRHNSVKIMVEQGWITISGFVEWAYQKRNIGFALSNLMGVVGVNNQLSVEPKIKSEAVKTDIEQALKRRAIEGVKHVSITVQGTEVTLTGHVHSWAERELVNHSAWNTSGVKSVVNHITIA